MLEGRGEVQLVGARRSAALRDLAAAGLLFAAGLGLTWLGGGVGLWVAAEPVYAWRAYDITDIAAQRHLLYLGRPGYGGSPLAYWDSDWYYSVAAEGYRFDGNPRRQQNVAFFPAYPLLTRLADAALPGGWTTAALGVAWACALGFLWAFLGLARLTVGPAAGLAATAALLYPAGAFLFLAYPTSLHLLAATLALLLWLRNRPRSAALAAGLASGTQPLGLAASLAVGLAAVARARRGELPPAQALALAAVSVWGLAGFAAYCWLRFGDPLTFASAQQGWQLRAGLLERFERALTLSPLRNAVTNADRLGMHPVNAALFLGLVGLALWSWRRLPRVVGVYGLLALGLAYLASAAGTDRMGSMARIAYSAVPAFLAFGLAVRGGRRLALVALAVSSLGFLVFAAMFAAGVFVQ